MFWFGFFCGMFVGANIGLIVSCILLANRDDTDLQDYYPH